MAYVVQMIFYKKRDRRIITIYIISYIEKTTKDSR